MHSEGARDSSAESERAETYLRLLAETALRHTASGEKSLAQRVWRAADVLIDAGVLPGTRATEILADLSTAVRARSRTPHFPSAMSISRLASFLPPRAGNPAERWRVIPADPGEVPGSRLMAVVLTADQALAPATLRFPPSADLPELQVPPWADLNATDNLGTRYRITFADGAWVGSTWTGTIMLHPAPPDAARWITISSQNGQLLRAEIPAAPGEGGGGATIRPVPESPGERLLVRRAEAMLAALLSGGLAGSHTAGYDQPGPAELIEILEAAGLLSPLGHAATALTIEVTGMSRQITANLPVRW